MPLDHRAPATTETAARSRATLTVVCPPVEGGVLDYANLIARHTGAALAHYADGALTPHTGHIDPAAPLYIQYSGYGYQKRGVPLAFLSWLKSQKQQGRSIGVFFHELYAMSSPQHSAFWLSPLQRHITAEIARLADHWITNRAASAAWLLRAAGDKPHAILPVCSNVGELTDLPAHRDPIVVVFGGAQTRQHVYANTRSSLARWLERHRLQLVDMGPYINDPATQHLLREARAEVLGTLPASCVSANLRRARFGILGTPLTSIGKSSVMAVYASHGVACMVANDDVKPSEGLTRDVNFISLADTFAVPPNMMDVEAVGTSAHAWYHPHGLSAHVEAALAFSLNATSNARAHRATHARSAQTAHLRS